jgi:hypothetical protein
MRIKLTVLAQAYINTFEILSAAVRRPDNYNNYYYYHHHHHHRISHFSALAGKYSPTLGFSNQQD